MKSEYRDIDKLLDRSVLHAQPLDRDLVRRIDEAIGPSLQAVRPMSSNGVLAGKLIVIGILVALLGAWVLGFQGWLRLSAAARVSISAGLGLVMWMTALAFVRERIPASGPRWPIASLYMLTTAVPLALFAALFRDYHTHRFFAAGVACLGTGLVLGVPMTLLAGVLLRRGYSVNPVGACGIAGLLGGVTGLLVLELHCPNLEASHVLVWHVLVIPVNAAIAAAAVFFMDRRRKRV
jgi:hypothetical protein